MIDTTNDTTLNKENETYIDLCMLSPEVSASSDSPAHQTSTSSVQRSKRRADTEPESSTTATKHQRVMYEWAHARVARENRNTAQDYLQQHEKKMEEYTLALMNLTESDHKDLDKVKAQYTKLIQHHYNKVKKAKQDAVRFQQQHEHHVRKLKLAAVDLKLAETSN